MPLNPPPNSKSSQSVMAWEGNPKLPALFTRVKTKLSINSNCAAKLPEGSFHGFSGVRHGTPSPTGAQKFVGLHVYGSH